MEIYDANMMLTDATRPAIVAYLEGRGYHPASLATMAGVALINTYHKEGWTATPLASDLQRACAQAVIAALSALPNGYVPPAPVPTLDFRTHYRTPLVTRIAGIGHHIMMVGPAGCGKTTIGEHVAAALEMRFYITSTVSESHELTGFVDGYGNYHSTPFRKAYEHGGVWIGDEIDAWEANALLTANAALANGLCTFPDSDEPVRRHDDFRAIATANTFGTGGDRVYVGRNELDAASLDRFATIDVDYDLDLERMFAGRNDRWLEHVWNVRQIVNEKKIRHVVSSRAIGMGSAALDAGIAWDDVNEIYLFKGMSVKDRSKIDV